MKKLLFNFKRMKIGIYILKVSSKESEYGVSKIL